LKLFGGAFKPIVGQTTVMAVDKPCCRTLVLLQAMERSGALVWIGQRAVLIALQNSLIAVLQFAQIMECSGPSTSDP
jgi:hypothetical protein